MSKKTVGLKALSTLARTGFKRRERVRLPSPPPRPATRRAVMADCSSPGLKLDKTEPQRNAHLLAMARGMPCLLRTRQCNGDRSTTVAAHSNLLIHGKGRGRKAEDCYSVWACARCHTWLDSSYDATLDDKEIAFLVAHLEQVEIWKAIVASPKASPKDRAAAKWALDTLNALAAARNPSEEKKA